MLYTEGLEFDLDGYVTAYTGSATAVIIPEYVVIDNLDKTKELVKVIGIRDGVFTNNKIITGVVLSEFITDKKTPLKWTGKKCPL